MSGSVTVSEPLIELGKHPLDSKMSESAIRRIWFVRTHVGLAAGDAELIRQRAEIQQGIDREEALHNSRTTRQREYEENLASLERRTREIR